MINLERRVIMKKFIKFLGVLSLSLVALTACGGETKTESDGKITIGATVEPHEKILNLIVDDLKEKGVELTVKGYTDWQLLNTAVAEGELDGNYFQHLPYLENYVEQSGEKLVSLGFVHIEPYGLYSNKYDNLDNIPDGAKIAVPDEATNRGRALKFLESLGLFELAEEAGEQANKEDIVSNPKGFVIEALDAAIIPRALDDVDLAVINGNYALSSGLDPSVDAIVLENAENNPYANVVAVKEADKDKPEFKALMEALHSDEVKNYINENYNGAVIPAN